MAENTLDVRLLHAAKTLDDWNNVTTIPKLGEVCLEIQGNTPPLNYKIKIGDGSSTYAALPYFGTVVNTSGNASVVVVDTITDGSVTRKVLKFYKFTLTTSTVNGVTTITPTIGDLILTVQEGDGINFSTNTTDTLVNVELEATTADTAQTIADGGTFTTITKDSNNRATKYTTFTLPSITSKINALDVADNTVITAEWDSTNKQIKLYYVKETDGIIQKGSLAYTINATDIAPVQNITTTDTGDSGLDITVNNNIKDVHHKAVNQYIIDHSNPAEEKELDIITNVNVDSYGHITGYTKDKSTNLVAADIKAPVRQSDNSMWNHRVTGGTINIGEDTAKISKLRGNTLVWNQLLGEGTFVDMGLPSGNLWATSNIDVTQPNKFAASPFQYEGSFFSWGNIEGHNPISTSAFDYNWGSVNSQGPWYDGQPYGDTAGAGLTTNIPVGETYDAARANLGAPWYMPQSADFQELVDNCIFINADGVEIPSDTTDKRVTVNGIVGLYLQSKTNGNRLFFSASGLGDGSSWYSRGAGGYYWSSSFSSSRYARSLNFVSGRVNPQNDSSRYAGFAVRAIAKTSDTIITDPNGHKYYVKNKQNVFDLTKMFGAGNEPTTVAEFEAMFPNSYYPYNEGELLSLKPTGVKSVGFNLWDGIFESGYYDTSNGQPSEGSYWKRSKNPITSFPNTDYYVKSEEGFACLLYYDAEMNYLSSSNVDGPVQINTIHHTPANCFYIHFYSSRNLDTICINLSDPSRNGTYEPYKESTLDLSWIKSIKDNDDNQLFPYGLLSAGSVHDEVGDNYAIKRIGVVDLGSLEWSLHDWSETGGEYGWQASFSGYKHQGTNSLVSQITSEKYIATAVNYLLTDDNLQCNIAFLEQINQSEVYCANGSRTTAPSGIIYYELAEPVTVYFDKKPMTYPVDDLGTETLLPQGVDSTTGVPLSAPFNGTFEYKSNFKDTVLDLINKVNNARNPVKGVTNTNQTVDKLAIYDSVETVKSSNYSPSNATIVEGATDNGIILPSVETIVNYVNSKLSSALTYKGTISQWSDLPTSGQSVGDMYIADTTFTEDDVTYQAGDFFIWNGTDWDIVSGTTSVVNSNPTLTPNGNTYQVGTVDGRPLQVTTPNLNYPSSPISSVGQSIDFIDTVSQTNGLVNATKKAIPSARTIVNGTNYDILVPLSASLWSSIYAPTTAGTNGQFLKSTAGTPIWATLGIGDLGLYSKNLKQNLNGQDTNLGNIIRNSNEDLNLPAFYAPLNAGTAYNLLISNGSGAPSWTTFLSTDNGYLKKTANGGWSLDPYGGGAKESVMNDGSVITASSSATAGLRKQTGSSNYEYQKISFAAITNDTATGNNAVTIILNGNFS